MNMSARRDWVVWCAKERKEQQQDAPDALDITVSPCWSKPHKLGPLANKSVHQQRALKLATARVLVYPAENPHRENNSSSQPL